MDYRDGTWWQRLYRTDTENFKKDGRRLADLLEFALHKTDMEKLDEQMQEVLSALVNENDVQVAAEKVIRCLGPRACKRIRSTTKPSFCIRNS